RDARRRPVGVPEGWRQGPSRYWIGMAACREEWPATIELVTLEEAKLQLRITDDAHDDDLNMKIKAASAAVVNYLHGTRNLYQPMLDSNGDFVTDNDGYYVADPGDSDGPQVREEVKAATLILLTDMFEKRAGAQ